MSEFDGNFDLKELKKALGSDADIGLYSRAQALERGDEGSGHPGRAGDRRSQARRLVPSFRDWIEPQLSPLRGDSLPKTSRSL